MIAAPTIAPDPSPDRRPRDPLAARYGRIGIPAIAAAAPFSATKDPAPAGAKAATAPASGSAIADRTKVEFAD